MKLSDNGWSLVGDKIMQNVSIYKMLCATAMTAQGVV